MFVKSTRFKQVCQLLLSLIVVRYLCKFYLVFVMYIHQSVSQMEQWKFRVWLRTDLNQTIRLFFFFFVVSFLSWELQGRENRKHDSLLPLWIAIRMFENSSQSKYTCVPFSCFLANWRWPSVASRFWMLKTDQSMVLCQVLPSHSPSLQLRMSWYSG